MSNLGYSGTADKKVERIMEFIPDHPEILKMDSAWALLKVDGFQCDDIEPSLFQAEWALVKAKELHRRDNSN